MDEAVAGLLLPIVASLFGELRKIVFVHAGHLTKYNFLAGVYVA
jgi:hypothetical protein